VPGRTNISERYKCVFLHIPKVAGTSVKQALELPGRGHPPWNWFAAHYPLEWRQYLKFSIVRNPWDRLVSAYIYATMKESFWHGEQRGMHPDYALLSGASFDTCCRILQHERSRLKHESWYPQHLWIARQANGRFESMVDLILGYERLEQDFSLLCEQLGAGQLVIPHINASERVGYREYYTDETRDIVAEVYATDIALFNYRF